MRSRRALRLRAAILIGVAILGAASFYTATERDLMEVLGSVTIENSLPPHSTMTLATVYNNDGAPVIEPAASTIALAALGPNGV